MAVTNDEDVDQPSVVFAYGVWFVQQIVITAKRERIRKAKPLITKKASALSLSSGRGVLVE